MRSAVVEGAHLRAGRDDEANHGVHVAKDVAGGNSYNTKTLPSEQRISSSIAPRLVAERVPLPIDFDDQAPLQAGEIDRHFANGELLPEFELTGSLTELLPQQHLRQAQLPAQLACALNLLDRCLKDAWAPSTTRLRRAVPLPVPGRIYVQSGRQRPLSSCSFSDAPWTAQ